MLWPTQNAIAILGLGHLLLQKHFKAPSLHITVLYSEETSVNRMGKGTAFTVDHTI